MYTPRAHPRHIVSIGGKLIVQAKEPLTIPCRILDLSDGGAKVKMDTSEGLPAKLLLYESYQQNIYECSVRWQQEDIAGLMFIDICPKHTRLRLIAECSLGLVPELSKEELEAARKEGIIKI